MNTLKNRINRRSVALVAAFAIVLGGTGISSLASLSSTLHDSVTFNVLNVSITDGGQTSASVTFSGIDPSADTAREQDLNITNSGTAAALVTVSSVVNGAAAGSDLDNAITVLASEGPCSSAGARINGAGVWPHIAATGASIAPFSLNAGANRLICLHFSIAASPNLTTTSLVAGFDFTGTH